MLCTSDVLLWCPGEPVPAAAGYAEGGGGEGDGASLRAVLLQPRQKGIPHTGQFKEGMHRISAK